MKNWWEKLDKTLVSILLLSFLICLSYSFWHKIPLAVDAKAYHAIAVNLLTGNGFVEDSSVNILFDRSIQRAGPTYEFFLAGLYWLFGIKLSVVWIAQAILHTASAWLLYQISRQVFGEKNQKIGLVAAIIFGLHPDLIEISAMVMTETLYLFLTILTVYFFVKLFEKNNWFNTGALAISLALGILARPPLLLFIPIIGFFYIVRKAWWKLLFFILLTISCLLPWTIRNYQIYHQVIPTTLIGEYNLWVGNTLQADGGQLAGGYNPFDEHAAKFGYLTIHGAATSAFKEFITNQPGRFLELCFIRTIRYFSLIRPMGFWFYQTGLPQLIFVGLSGLGIVGLFTLGLTGLIKMYKAKNRLFNYLIVFTISAPLLLLPTVVQSRYRFQIYPFFALAAGYAISQLWQNKSWWKDKELLISVGILGTITLIDILLSARVVIDRLQSFL